MMKFEKRYDVAFLNVMALYAAIKESGREKLRGTNTDPLDFIADVELHAKKVLEYYYEDFMALIKDDPNKYTEVKPTIRNILGKEFLEAKLSLGGSYRKLYFIVKVNNA